MAGTFTVSGQSAGLATGQKTVGPLTITGASVVGAITDVNLVAGDNTITIPPNAIAVWIVPPATNTQTLKVRTSANNTDGGLPISASDPFGPFSWRGLTPTTVIINSAGTVNGVELSWI